MGFIGGQNDKEKANDAAINNLTNALVTNSQTADKRAKKSFKFFKQAAKPSLEYWNSLLSGNNEDIQAAIAPELNSISGFFDAKRSSNANLTPRGGLRASSNIDLDNAEMAQLGNATLGVRPSAAGNLAGLASLFSGTSQGQSGLSLSGNQAATGNLFNLNREQEAVRARQAAFWGSIGEGVGSIAGGWLGGK